MKSTTNIGFRFALLGLGAMVSACNGEDAALEDNTEETLGVAEQKYTPIGRLVSYNAPAIVSPLSRCGGGDADMYTQKNRIYGIIATATKPFYEPGKVTTTVSYDISEKYPDYTHLCGSTTVVIPIPDNTYRVNQVVSTESRWDLSEKCNYSHCWYANHKEITNPYDYSTIRVLDYKYDDDGPEDNGRNAYANYWLAVTLDVTDY